MKDRDIVIQTWKSSEGDLEIQHFLNDKYGTYLFGFNKKLIGKKAYNNCLTIIRTRLQEQGLIQ